MMDIESSIDVETIYKASVECAGCGIIEENDMEDSENEAVARLLDDLIAGGWAIAGSKECQVMGPVCKSCLDGEGEIKDWVKE